MKKGLGAKLKELFKIGQDKEEFFEELEDLLIEGDLGANTSVSVVDELREYSKKKKLADFTDLKLGLKEILMQYVKEKNLEPLPDVLNFFLILGVNGVGKTTTIAKLADYYRRTSGLGVLLSAGDTFRAAAIDQIKLHGERLKFRVVSQAPGSDPGAVMFDSIESAQAKGERLILADTAGRMHTKANLVKELQKIDKVIKGKIGNGNYKTLLVLDATTGQNGLRQAEIFHEAIGIDSVVLTKYDSTAKGGIAVSVSKNLGLPISFIGKGEKYGDIAPFKVAEYLDDLLELS